MSDCEEAKTNFRDAHNWFERNKENYKDYHQKIRTVESTITTKENVIHDIDRKLYYLNDKIGAKTSKIETLKQERDREKAKDDNERDDSKIRSLQNELEQHARERDGFESDRDDATRERQKVNDRIAELEKEAAAARRGLDDTKDALAQFREKMKTARADIEEHCGSASGFDVPNMPNLP